MTQASIEPTTPGRAEAVVDEEAFEVPTHQPPPHPETGFVLNNSVLWPRIDANLRAIASEANEALGDVIDVTGPLSAIPRERVAYDVGLLPQVRSRPLPAFGGGEFRCNVPLGEVTETYDRGLRTVIDAAQSFVASRDTVAQSLSATSQDALAAVERHPCPTVPASIVAVGVCAGADMPTCDHFVEIEILGHGLDPVVSRVQAQPGSDLVTKLSELMKTHIGRARLRGELQASGLRGWIEEPARRIMAEGGMDPAFALEQLRRRQIFRFVLPNRKGLLYWREGVLRCEFNSPDAYGLFQKGNLTLHRSLPAKALASRVGGQLGRLLKEPLLPEEAVILGYDRGWSWTSLDLAMPMSPWVIEPSGTRARRKSGSTTEWWKASSAGQPVPPG